MSWNILFAGLAGAVLGLGPLVFIHELGHFFALKWFNLPVHAFSLGFGKAIWKKKFRHTEYRLSVLPLGGYVMPEDPNLVQERQKSGGNIFPPFSPFQNIIIALGGPVANIVLAGLLFFIILNLWGEPKPCPVIETVVINTPAFNAGLKADDKIVQIDEIAIGNWDDLTKATQNSVGNLIKIQVERNGKTIFKVLKPIFDGSKFVIGIRPKFVASGPLSPLEACKGAITRTANEVDNVAHSLLALVNPSNAAQISGPVAIISQTFAITRDGIASFLGFIALLSVNFAVFNLLPIPPLDGTRIALSLWELTIGKPLKEKVILPFYKVGIIGLAIIFALVTLKDFGEIIKISLFLPS
ncbi:MAG: RIP metalloprotease RseP [Candidatus Riflebacteria bacterium]|nr:RIP metalloprotease RseP [Candidatus Riflebacteria bacterium]